MGQSPEEDETTALPRDLRFLKDVGDGADRGDDRGRDNDHALLVIRLNGAPPVTIAPGDFEIPDGVGVVGLSVIDGRTVIVGDDGVIRVYDSESRACCRSSRSTE
jgi:hypothetical protein